MGAITLMACTSFWPYRASIHSGIPTKDKYLHQNLNQTKIWEDQKIYRYVFLFDADWWNGSILGISGTQFGDTRRRKRNRWRRALWERKTHCSNWTPVGFSHGICFNSIMASTIFFSLRVCFLLIRFRVARPWDETKDDKDTRQGLYVNELNINILHKADSTWIPVAERKERKREKYRYGGKVARQTNKQVLQKWRVGQMGTQKNRD